MAVDKKITYDDKPVVQGGVDNYLGKQPQVVAPRKWKSAPDKPETELAYITKAEKDLILKANIHGGLEDGPNMGPSGIMSLDSFGDIGGAGAAGVDTDPGGGYDTGPKGGGFTGKGPNESDTAFEFRKMNQKELLQNAEKIQAQNLGIRERDNISDFTASRNPLQKFFRTISQFSPIGFLAKGLGSLFGNLKNARGFNLDGTPRTQEEYEEARQQRINEKRISNILGRDAPITEMTLQNLSKLGYTGDMPAVGSTPVSRAIAKDNLFDPNAKLQNTSFTQSDGITSVASLEDLDEIGQGVDFVSYDKLRNMGLSEGAGDGTNPKLGELTGFIDPLATITARRRELDNMFTDASSDNRKILEQLINPDLRLDEALEKKDIEREREKELLEEIMRT